MNKRDYRPSDAGKQVQIKMGKNVIIRKYHLTEEDFERIRNKWLEEVKEISDKIKEKVGKNSFFFNPYRKGIYHYQVQALYLLGANEWHSLKTIMNKLEEIMSLIRCSEVKKNKYRCNNEWEYFRNKKARSVKAKDEKGRVQENMILMQRLTKLHPYGYKLKQVGASIDIKIVNNNDDLSIYFYKLNTLNDLNSLKE